MTSRSTSWFPKNELDGLFAKMKNPSLAAPKAEVRKVVPTPAPAPTPTMPPVHVAPIATAPEPAPTPAPEPPPAPAHVVDVQAESKLLAQWKKQSQALIEVARSKEMSRGLLQESLQFMTQKAAETLQAERVGVWFYYEALMELQSQTI